MQDETVSAATFEVVKSDDEWRRILKGQAYTVMRHHGTERPYSSSLNHEKRKGTFHCAGCELALFASETKYESNTGWPSFYRPLPNAIGTRTDRSLLIARTEVHCRRCGGNIICTRSSSLGDLSSPQRPKGASDAPLPLRLSSCSKPQSQCLTSALV